MKIITTYFFIIGIAGVLLAGFLSDWLVKRKGLRFGRRFLGVLPLSLLALSFLVAALTSNNTVVVISLYFGQLFYSFYPIVSFSTCVDIGGDRVGTVAGIKNFFGQTGAFFLAIAFGKIADTTHSFNIPLFIVAGVLFVGSMLWFFVDASRPITAETRYPT
jgi:sugar phosphate permease